MRDLKNRLKRNWKKKKVLWVFGIIGILVIAFWPLSSFVFGGKNGSIVFSLSVFLYVFCSGIYMVYHAFNYKEALSMVGRPAPKDKNPIYYYFAILVFIGMIIFSGWAFIMIIIKKILGF